MKNFAIALALLTSAPAFAIDYHCVSESGSVKAYTAWDSSGAGLDHVSLSFSDPENFAVKAVEYTDFGGDDMKDRDNDKGVYDYAGDTLAIGFDAKDGTKFDFDLKLIDEKLEIYGGEIRVTKADGKKLKLKATCIED